MERLNKGLTAAWSPTSAATRTHTHVWPPPPRTQSALPEQWTSTTESSPPPDPRPIRRSGAPPPDGTATSECDRVITTVRSPTDPVVRSAPRTLDAISREPTEFEL
eukprot:1193484-Prorocentrum_minimum.AAC.9